MAWSRDPRALPSLWSESPSGAHEKTALQGILSESLATQAEAELAARAEAQAEARFSANGLLQPKSQGRS